MNFLYEFTVEKKGEKNTKYETSPKIFFQGGKRGPMKLNVNVIKLQTEVLNYKKMKPCL